MPKHQNSAMPEFSPREVLALSRLAALQGHAVGYREFERLAQDLDRRALREVPIAGKMVSLWHARFPEGEVGAPNWPPRPHDVPALWLGRPEPEGSLSVLVVLGLLAVLLKRSRIGLEMRAAAEDFGGLALSEVELLPHADDEARVNDGCIHLRVERLHLAHDALGFGHVGDGLIARGAKISRYRWNHGGFALVGVGQVAGVVDQFRHAANRTFHGHSSLKDTISTSSMTVSFR